MSDTRCADCEWLHVDNEFRRRCYSPQLRRLGVPGILINFERSEDTEEGRNPDTATQKCGPMKLNYRRRNGL